MRSDLAKHALGPTLVSRIQNAKILVVGAGGIGCELLKNLALSGFGNIMVVDMDTIDLSNLNRQFLFNMQHIKKSKAMVAAESAKKFNPDVNISAHHGNIKDPEFKVKWFKTFDLVINALDNLDARRHVNKMCLAADVPLIESGTTGFNGQVQVIKRNETECYDCTPKPVPKSFPVCTIRSTPSQPIHCIVWAKSYLFSELFSHRDDDSDDFDHTKDSENAEEIRNLRIEAKALMVIRESLGSPEFAKKVFQKVFRDDINRLRSMEQMWTSRAKPEPLGPFDEYAATEIDINATAANNQGVWSLVENIAFFVNSLKRLAQRVQKQKSAGEDYEIVFDKDDEDALDFVTASSNLRSVIFSIDCQSKFNVKQMAGNIIPAIATTNAITAGLCVLEAFKIFRNRMSEAKMVFLSMSTDRTLNTEVLRGPNESCQVCGAAQVELAVDINRTMLKDIVESCLQSTLGYSQSLTVMHNSLIFDEDFDDNLEKSFAELGISDGAFVTVIDDADEQPKANLVFQVNETNFPEDIQPFRIPEGVKVPLRSKSEQPAPTMVLSGKGTLDLDGPRSPSLENAKKRKWDDSLSAVELSPTSTKKTKSSVEIEILDNGYIEIE